MSWKNAFLPSFPFLIFGVVTAVTKSLCSISPAASELTITAQVHRRPWNLRQLKEMHSLLQLSHKNGKVASLRARISVLILETKSLVKFGHGERLSCVDTNICMNCMRTFSLHSSLSTKMFSMHLNCYVEVSIHPFQ